MCLGDLDGSVPSVRLGVVKPVVRGKGGVRFLSNLVTYVLTCEHKSSYSAELASMIFMVHVFSDF